MQDPWPARAVRLPHHLEDAVVLVRAESLGQVDYLCHAVAAMDWNGSRERERRRFWGFGFIIDLPRTAPSTKATLTLASLLNLAMTIIFFS